MRERNIQKELEELRGVEWGAAKDFAPEGRVRDSGEGSSIYTATSRKVTGSCLKFLKGRNVTVLFMDGSTLAGMLTDCDGSALLLRLGGKYFGIPLSAVKHVGAQIEEEPGFKFSFNPLRDFPGTGGGGV